MFEIIRAALLGAFLGVFHVNFLGTIVHELGHLVFGKLTGYGFVSFRVASFVWYKEEGKIRFARSKSNVSGQCLMEPNSNVENFKFVWYNLGGGVFNLLFAAMFLAVYIAASASAYNGLNFPMSFFLGVGIFANMFLAFISLAPIILAGTPVDGRNVLTALKSKDAKRGLYTMLYVNSEMAKGKRYRDFDSELFAVDSNADLNNYFVAFLVMLMAEWFIDVGEVKQGFLTFSRLNLSKLPTAYSNGVKLFQLHYHTIHQPAMPKAHAIYNDKKIKAIFNTSNIIEYAGIIATYEYFGRGDKDKALQVLERANKNLHNHPNMGERIILKKELEIAAARIEEAENKE